MKSHPINFNHCFSLTVPMPGPPKTGKNTKGLWIKAIKKQHTRRSPAIQGLCCLMSDIYKSTNSQNVAQVLQLDSYGVEHRRESNCTEIMWTIIPLLCPGLKGSPWASRIVRRSLRNSVQLTNSMRYLKFK